VADQCFPGMKSSTQTKPWSHPRKNRSYIPTHTFFSRQMHAAAQKTAIPPAENRITLIFPNPA
jgi:hypothetical protein